MAIEQWWSKLDVATRQWLIDHNGEPIPPGLVDDIRQAGGTPAIETDLVHDEDASGLVLSGEASDWVESVANDEFPG
ncbi:hypothetical protein ACFQ58_15675 [Agromyces sp. NPDC056523]|uniref:hypothetical protein n=1 Tax=Agromyces sp. NPDC056523 TaxID=3345850 RepID=UPI0036713CC4